MPSSSRFAVAVHILTLLEIEGGRPLTSDYIAWSVNTNPGFVRRVLAMLGRAGLVRSQLGAGGGAFLAKPASRIGLLDVYRAVESGDVFVLHHSTPNPRCPVGKNIQPALRKVLSPAERALEGQLANVTLAEMADSVRALAGRPVGNRART